MGRFRSILLRTLPLCVGIVLLGVVSLPPQHSSALSGSDFNPGRIIDDNVFTNASSMSAQEIQDFLNAKVGSCDNNGSQIYSGSETHAQYDAWRAQQGDAVDTTNTKFTCINQYYENTSTHANNLDGNPIPSGAISAAQIIYNAAQQYQINPQVILTTLQKEQGIVTDTWPWDSEYKLAMGYACPDTAPCDSQYYGFYNQVSSAAWQFRQYLTNPNNYNYVVGNNYLLYNPQSSCGGSTVYIEDQSTAALYDYTPYQPNAGALSNISDSSAGGADGGTCGSYGNRNFWWFFNVWFGSSIAPATFQPFSDPRRLVLTTDTQKIDTADFIPSGSVIPAGTVRKFVSKIQMPSGNWCYRTEADQGFNANFCIPAADLAEITITYTAVPLDQQTMEIKGSGYKVDLRRNVQVGSVYPATRQITFTEETQIEGTTYYVSAVDATAGNELGIPASMLESSPAFTSISPTYMQVTQSTAKTDVGSLQTVGGQLPVGTTRTFISKTQINGTWYYRTQDDDAMLLGQAIPATDLTSNLLQAFVNPRCFVVTGNTNYINGASGLQSNEVASQGMIAEFTYKIVTNTGMLYQADADHTANDNLVLPAGSLANYPCYQSFASPRNLRLNTTTAKIVPDTGAHVGSYPAGMVRMFTSKTLYNGVWYYRTQADTNTNSDLGFPASDLSEVGS